jgi:MreB/Mrl family cell shape determining protein
VVRPLKNGVIADFRLAQVMLDYFIRKAHNRTTLVHPRIVISVPSEITQVEGRAVMESAYRARASEVHLVEQAMMAAIGAGLPVSKPRGNLIVDIGGGTTDIAVISLNGIVYARSLRMAPEITWMKPLPTTSSENTICSSENARRKRSRLRLDRRVHWRNGDGPKPKAGTWSR